MEKKFKAGDRVRFREDTQIMTVKHYETKLLASYSSDPVTKGLETGRVVCTWDKGKEKMEKAFLDTDLMLAEA